MKIRLYNEEDGMKEYLILPSNEWYIDQYEHRNTLWAKYYLLKQKIAEWLLVRDLMSVEKYSNIKRNKNYKVEK